MSRQRQALGVISNNFVSAAANVVKGQQQQQQGAQQQMSKSASFKSKPAVVNDENEPPQSFLKNANDAKSKDLDFEIFQEELSNSKCTRFNDVKLKEAEDVKVGDKENLAAGKKEKKAQVVFSNDYDDEDDEEEEDEEEEDEEEDYEEDEEEEDDVNEELEEEGISRLNLAPISEDVKNEASTSVLMSLDSSSNNDLSSPMVLDDTIAFQSRSGECDASLNDSLDEDSRRKAERDNLIMNCFEYKDDIMNYMRKIECENRPKANYMKKQQDITASMRSILVDWLVEVTEEYKLNAETLYLAVNYTDRFLSQMSVLRGKLQLVGTASMYIASKYEEISPPDVAEFVFITDDTYTKKQVLRMEHLLLKVLDFNMSSPTINYFLTHYLRFLKVNFANDLHQRVENLSRYLAELTLIDADTYLSYLPSQIAASAIYLALCTFNKPWTKQIAEQLNFSHDLSELKSCIVDMHKTMVGAADHPQQAIQEKYKQAKYDYVSLIEPLKSLPTHLQQ